MREFVGKPWAVLAGYGSAMAVQCQAPQVLTAQDAHVQNAQLRRPHAGLSGPQSLAR